MGNSSDAGRPHVQGTRPAAHMLVAWMGIATMLSIAIAPTLLATHEAHHHCAEGDCPISASLSAVASSGKSLTEAPSAPAAITLAVPLLASCMLAERKTMANSLHAQGVRFNI